MTQQEKNEREMELLTPAEPFVVGIGASAGGLEALQQFFRFMPPNSGLSFVVIQHLSPDYKSLMADILGKYTDMEVLQVEEGVLVEPNKVYLIPPKKNLTFHAGRLFLRDYVQGTLNHPIDIFFNSLAEEQKEHAIAVVLSGTGSDGTGGIRTTRELPLLHDDRHPLCGWQPQHPQVHRVHRPRVPAHGAGCGPLHPDLRPLLPL